MATASDNGAAVLKLRRTIPVLIVVALLAGINLWLQSAAGTRWLLEQADYFAPGELTYGKVERGDDVIAISELGYRDSAVEFRIDDLRIKWRPWKLLFATLSIDMLHGNGVAIKAFADDAPEAAPPTGFILPIYLTMGDTRLAQVRFEPADGQQAILIDTISLRAHYWWDTLSVEQLSLTRPDFSVAVRGSIASSLPFPFSATVTGEYRHPEIERISVAARISGTLEKWSSTGRAMVDGGILKGTSATWQADYADAQLTLAHVTGVLPDKRGQARVNGEINWRGPSLHYRMNGSVSQLGLSSSDAPLLTVNQGTFALVGEEQAYRLNATASLVGTDLPASDWQLAGRGTLSEFIAETLQIDLLEGSIQASGRLTRNTGWHWRGAVEAKGINPAAQWAEWPGSLSGNATFQGALEDSLIMEVPDLKVDGTLRQQRFSLGSAINLQGSTLRVDEMELDLGGARVTGIFTLGDELNTRLTLNAPDLSKLWPGVEGSIQAQLQSSGPRQQPHLKADYQAKDIRYDQYALSSLRGALDFDLGGHHPWVLTTDARDVDTGIKAFSPLAVSLDVKGDASTHQLTLTASNATQRLSSRVKGSWQSPQWHGEITTLRFSDPQLGQWREVAPTKLTVSDSLISVDKSCFESQSTQACLAYQRDHNAAQKLQLTLDQFGLSRLNRITTEYAALDLPLDVDIDVAFAAEGTPSGSVRLALGRGTITPVTAIPTLQATPTHIAGGELQAKADGETVDAQMQLRLVTGSYLQGNATMKLTESWRERPELQPLQAKLVIALRDLDLLPLVIEPLDNPEGKLDGELTFAGTLAAPNLTGELKLIMTQAKLPRLGLTLRDTQLVAESHKPGRLDLSLHSSSGKGGVRAQGWFEAKEGQGWESSLTIAGENVEVSHIPEAKVSLSPQLQLIAEANRLSIKGEVQIDEARLEPRDLTRATSPSEDVVVVNAEQEIEPPSPWKVYTDIRVIAADNIHLKGFGFMGYLGGGVRIISEPQHPPRATGELHIIKGASYRAFSQDLTMEHGRLYFTDAPLDDPALDINAVRKVGDVTVGVKVGGTALAPELTLFSQPAMDQIDILSYLTLGRPFERAGTNDGNSMREAASSAGLAGGDYLLAKVGSRFELDEARLESQSESGEPWLVLGRYLSPRLYVRYGVGLIEGGNSLIMRYQLSDTWSLQGEVGQNTGSDLIYTIERP